MAESAEFNLVRIDRVRYRPTKVAEEFLNQLRSSLIPGDKATVARLAIARSLVAEEVQALAMVDRAEEMGNAIEGAHLFGADGDCWACLIVEGAAEKIENSDQFRRIVEAHWHRGALLLEDDYKAHRRNDVEFSVFLAGLAGDSSAEGNSGNNGMNPAASAGGFQSVGPLTIRIGEIGIEQRSNAVLTVELNAPGNSPHIAFMGKTRSGKTRTGIHAAEAIAGYDLPMVLIDPKGEFVNDGKLVEKSEWGGKTLADRFPGIVPIDVPTQPIPLDFLAQSPDSSEADLAQAAIAFRDSFQKCVRAKGDVAMDTLRSVVFDLLQRRTGAISLEKIRDRLRETNEDAGKKTNSIDAKLNELTSLKLFNPINSPAEFFAKRWVIGLGSAPEESKRLVMFLVLDALSRYMLSLGDSKTDSRGYRSVRHLLVVDEAKEILSYKHEALSNLIRKSAARGQVVMLLSQSPEDFDSESDDFLSQMGTIGVFASNAQSLRNLRAALGQKTKPEDFSDKALPRGMALVKVPQKEPSKVLAWR